MLRSGLRRRNGGATFLAWRGLEPTGAGIAAHYDDLVDALVLDEALPDQVALVTDLLMDGAESRARLARETLDFVTALGPRSVIE